MAKLERKKLKNYVIFTKLFANLKKNFDFPKRLINKV